MTARLFSRRFRAAVCSGMLLFSFSLRLALSPVALDRVSRAALVLCGKDVADDGAPHPSSGLRETPDDAFPQGGRLDAPTQQETAGVISPEDAVGAIHESPDGTTPDPVILSEAKNLGADGPVFAAAEADAISMRGNCTYAVDKRALLTAPLPFTVGDGPLVLIVHSHTSEAYTPSDGCTYVPSGDYRTLDETRNVLAVGDALASALTSRGIGVLHDRTCNDYPSYNDSYWNAKGKIEQWLADNPSVVLVIDVHRDALDEPVREAATVDGVDCAKLMLVVGTDEGGLYHPYWQENLTTALKLQALLLRAHPELMRQLNLRKERFNGQTSPGAFIVEVGSTGNTLTEAINSMPYLAEAVAELLRQ